LSGYCRHTTHRALLHACNNGYLNYGADSMDLLHGI
jgi:hypothetical protein